MDIINTSGVFEIDDNGVLVSFKPSPDNIFPSYDDGKHLLKLEIPEGVVTIPQGFFSNYSVFQYLLFPHSITKIEKYAFAYSTICRTLLSVYPSHVDRTAFWGANVSVTIPDNFSYLNAKKCIEYIDLYAFSAPGLSHKYMSIEHFPKCDELTMIENESGVFFLDDEGALRNYKLFYMDDYSLKNKKRTVRNLYIPDGVTVIPGSFFRGIAVLGELTLPDSLQLLGTGDGCAFADCILPDIRIGDKVKLGHYTFGSGEINSLSLKNGFHSTCRDFKDCKIKTLYLRMNSSDEVASYHLDARVSEVVEVFES